MSSVIAGYRWGRFLILGCIIMFTMVFVGQGVAGIDPKTTFLVWTFEAGAGDTVRDLSGNGNDGIITGCKWDKGKTGTGLKLSGANNKIVSATSNGVGKTFFTECLWMNFESFSTEAQFGYIVSKGTASPRFFYFSSWSSAGGEHNCIHAGVLDAGGGWGRGISTGRLFEKGKWYFLTCVIDTKQGFIKTYVDGELAPGGQVAISPGDVPGTPAEIWVGGTPENYQWINGTIDDVALFNIALEEDEINTIMKNGIARGIAVDPSGRLPITWAHIKTR